MDQRAKRHSKKQAKVFLYSKGSLYFNMKTERRFFFLLALLMLCLGFLVKLGLL